MKTYWLLLAIVVILLPGCKSSQEFYNRKGDLKNITDVKLINNIESNYLKYDNLFFKKFKAEIEFNGDSKSFKGNMFLANDSCIVVSINPLMGIELFRVKLSPDKVEIIDRTKKKYIEESYQLLWDKFMVELDYHTIQSILLDELYTYPVGNIEGIKKYKHYCTQDEYLFESVKKGKYNRKYRKEKVDNMIYHQLSIMPEIFKVSKSYIRDFDVNSEVTINYSDFRLVNEVYLPQEININGKRSLNSFLLNVSFENIEVDGNNSIGFKISDKYKKVNASDGK